MTKKMISWLSVLAVFLTLLGACRQEDLLLKEEKNNQKVLSSKILHYQDLEKRKAVFGELMKLTNDSHNSKTARTYTDHENGFSVDLEDVMYTEDPFGGKTYTFKITRDTPKANLENLVMVEQKDGLLETFIFEYDKEVELNYFSSSLELKNSLMEHVTITNLGTRKSIGQNAKMLYDCDNIIATWVETPGTTCPDGNYNHTFEDEDACVYWGTVDMALPAYGGHYEYTFQIGNCGGGASTGSGTTGTTGPYHGGGSGTGTILNTPCAKTKSMLNRPNVQAGITTVKAQALQTLSNINTGETGFKEKKDGTTAPADLNSSHKVVYNDVTDGVGGYHNHTANGTHMFSPPDIGDTLLGFAAAQNNVSDAYFGMIAAEWCNCPPSNQKYIHYVIQYTGAASDLGVGGIYNFTAAQMTQFENDYRKTVRNLKNTYINGNTYIQTSGELNEKGLEKLFFEMLNTMGLTGNINLQRVEANGTIYNVTLDSNNMPTGTPCP